MKIVWTKTAAQARLEQLNYIANDKPEAALRLDLEIEQQIRTLSIHPEIGRVGRVDGTRELVIVRTPFVAVYRIHNKRIEILRFLHGAQQWPKSNRTVDTF